MKSTIEDLSSSTIERQQKSLIALLEIYVDQRFGPEIWDSQFENDRFTKVIMVEYPKYGDLIFHEVIQILALSTRVPIKDLIMDFGNFINKYF